MAAPPVVAVLNTSDDVVELLRIVFEQAGLVVVSAHVDEIRRGDASLGDFVAEHDPQLLVYDVSPPYDRSWRFLEHVRQMPIMHGRKWVITTTNVARVREIAGAEPDVHEIVGKPYDINEILDSVLRALGLKDDLPGGARRA